MQKLTHPPHHLALLPLVKPQENVTDKRKHVGTSAFAGAGPAAS
jgi:hypothetical protein